MKEPQADGAIKKIPCDECRKMIPKGTALTDESWDKVRYFCDTICFEEWSKKSKETKSENKNGNIEGQRDDHS